MKFNFEAGYGRGDENRKMIEESLEGDFKYDEEMNRKLDLLIKIIETNSDKAITDLRNKYSSTEKKEMKKLILEKNPKVLLDCNSEIQKILNISGDELAFVLASENYETFFSWNDYSGDEEDEGKSELKSPFEGLDFENFTIRQLEQNKPENAIKFFQKISESLKEEIVSHLISEKKYSAIANHLFLIEDPRMYGVTDDLVEEMMAELFLKNEFNELALLIRSNIYQKGIPNAYILAILKSHNASSIDLRISEDYQGLITAIADDESLSHWYLMIYFREIPENFSFLSNKQQEKILQKATSFEDVTWLIEKIPAVLSVETGRDLIRKYGMLTVKYFFDHKNEQSNIDFGLLAEQINSYRENIFEGFEGKKIERDFYNNSFELHSLWCFLEISGKWNEDKMGSIQKEAVREKLLQLYATTASGRLESFIKNESFSWYLLQFPPANKNVFLNAFKNKNLLVTEENSKLRYDNPYKNISALLEHHGVTADEFYVFLEKEGLLMPWKYKDNELLDLTHSEALIDFRNFSPSAETIRRISLNNDIDANDFSWLFKKFSTSAKEELVDVFLQEYEKQKQLLIESKNEEGVKMARIANSSHGNGLVTELLERTRWNRNNDSRIDEDEDGVMSVTLCLIDNDLFDKEVFTKLTKGNTDRKKAKEIFNFLRANRLFFEELPEYNKLFSPVIDPNFERAVKAAKEFYGEEYSEEQYNEFNDLLNGKIQKSFSEIGVTKTGVEGIRQLNQIVIGVTKKLLKDEDTGLALRNPLIQSAVMKKFHFNEAEWGKKGNSDFEKLFNDFNALKGELRPLNPAFHVSGKIEIKRLAEKKDYVPSEQFLARYKNLAGAAEYARKLIKNNKVDGLDVIFSEISEKRNKMIIELQDRLEKNVEPKAEIGIKKKIERLEFANLEQVSDAEAALMTLSEIGGFEDELLKFYFAMTYLRDEQRLQSYIFDKEPDLKNTAHLLEFVDHITNQESWKEFFTDKRARKAFEGLINTRALSEEMVRMTTGGSKTTTPFQFFPTRNFLTEISGHIADACWASKYSSILEDFPNFTSLIMVQNPESPQEKIAGAAMLIECEAGNDQKLLVIRGLNPQQNVITQLDQKSFVDSVVKYLQPIAEKQGRKLAIVIDDHPGGAATNRPSLYQYLWELKSSLKNVVLAKPDKKTDGLMNITRFNNYDITGKCYLIESI